ncbi:DUF4199 domain-containing protein [Winogradskyella sp. KYW1333]|jgi:hypothetical protein|uniref:DUF4199 domain-containing protein n=1 Tax=Winogradskyella sp. KYW1333 TaxID=2282123 RepID=UPI000DF123AB|nr:DUF4199 domain-containing protein [Winogradskyella sp. KYW1333]RCT55141.1 DUF4199 domain-containing protein [Winogradskyella sp. KYW1333]
MENQKPTAGKFALNYGVILGVLMIAIGVVTYVTGMALEGQQWPNIIYYIAFPVVIMYAISQYKKANANTLGLGDAIKVGLSIAVISAIVYLIYGLLFNYVIDPEFMGQMMEVQRDKLLENPNMTPEAVEQSMKMMEMMFNPFIGSAFWVAMSAFFGLIYSLIGGLVMKTKSN